MSGGLVAAPAAFSLDELQRMPRTDVRVRHHCVEGWSAVAGWHGVRLRDLAERVGAAARRATSNSARSTAGITRRWDRESAFHPQTILAYGMNGEPLSPRYGAPLRLYGAVKLGYKMVKYIDELKFLPTKTGGYWEDRGVRVVRRRVREPMLRLMHNTMVLLLALAGSQLLAGGPTQVKIPPTIKADKRMLAAGAKMEQAMKKMLAASQQLVGGGNLEAARRDLTKGDTLLRQGDTELADGIRMRPPRAP